MGGILVFLVAMAVMILSLLWGPLAFFGMLGVGFVVFISLLIFSATSIDTKPGDIIWGCVGDSHTDRRYVERIELPSRRHAWRRRTYEETERLKQLEIECLGNRP